MDQAQVMKREREDWSRMYHKTLKGLETMIDIQRMVKDIKKLVEEVNMTIIKVEGSVLTASINNRVMNATNITCHSMVRYRTNSRVRVRTSKYCSNNY